MKSKQTLWLLCVAAVLGLSACGGKGGNEQAPAQQQQASQSQEASQQAESGSQQEAASMDNFLSNTQALQAAEDSLKALPQFSGKELNVFQNVQFYGSSRPRIEIDIQDPEKPDNIDHYTYEDGKWSEPQPVQISGGGDMKDNVTPLKDIKFATVASIAKIWSEKAKEVEASETQLDFVSFQLWVPNQTRRWITSTIETPRAKYSADFNVDGTLKEFEKQ